MNIIEHFLSEGPRDPNIFKAVFTAGLPGAGKTTLIKQMVAGSGLKLASFDSLYEFLKKKDGFRDDAIAKSDELLNKQVQGYVAGRLGLIVDKTSWNYDHVKTTKKDLESLGYDTMMVFVNTDINVAKQRARERFKVTGRKVDEEYIDSIFAKLNASLGKYQSDFGRNFIIVDNTEEASDVQKISTEMKWAQNKVSRFLRTPPTKREATNWINNQP